MGILKNKLKIKKTVMPKEKLDFKQKNVTIGEIASFWEKDGNFNLSLYRRISVICAMN